MPAAMTMVSRRRLLGGAALLFAGLPVASLATQPLALTEAEASTLVLAARALFPHALLSDASYRGIIDFAFPATAEAAKLQSAREAVRQLESGPVAFAAMSETARQQALAPRVGTPFFQGLRIAVLIGLYADLGVTRRFGYQGPSFEDGGYLERGYDSLPWLPSPKGLEASRWPI